MFGSKLKKSKIKQRLCANQFTVHGTVNSCPTYKIQYYVESHPQIAEPGNNDLIMSPR